jgi:hypothetical protein
MVPTVILLNGLLGGICGFWFRVQIFIPLLAVGFVEAAVLKQPGNWGSVIWPTVGLIIAMEMGYLIGSALTSLRAHLKLGKFSARPQTQGHR